MNPYLSGSPSSPWDYGSPQMQGGSPFQTPFQSPQMQSPEMQGVSPFQSPQMQSQSPQMQNQSPQMQNQSPQMQNTFTPQQGQNQDLYTWGMTASSFGLIFSAAALAASSVHIVALQNNSEQHQNTALILSYVMIALSAIGLFLFSFCVYKVYMGQESPMQQNQQNQGQMQQSPMQQQGLMQQSQGQMQSPFGGFY